MIDMLNVWMATLCFGRLASQLSEVIVVSVGRIRRQSESLVNRTSGQSVEWRVGVTDQITIHMLNLSGEEICVQIHSCFGCE